jgi:hypothetical protein
MLFWFVVPVFGVVKSLGSVIKFTEINLVVEEGCVGVIGKCMIQIPE